MRTIDFLPVITFAACVATMPVSADTPLPIPKLALIDSRVSVEIIGLNNNLSIFETHPIFKELSAATAVGSIHGLADLLGSPMGAVLKASAGSMDNQYQTARPSFTATFRNVGLVPIDILLGEIKVEVTASFSHASGVGESGFWANQFNAGLSSTLGTGEASLVAAFSQPGTSPVQGGAGVDSQGGFVGILNSASSSGLSATLLFPARHLLPGDDLFLNVALDSFAHAAGPGWSAFTDAGNSALLTMRLPAGVTLESSVPLPWVTITAVPEPGSALLLLAGAGAMVLRHRRNLLTTTDA